MSERKPETSCKSISCPLRRRVLLNRCRGPLRVFHGSPITVDGHLAFDIEDMYMSWICGSEAERFAKHVDVPPTLIRPAETIVAPTKQEIAAGRITVLHTLTRLNATACAVVYRGSDPVYITSVDHRLGELVPAEKKFKLAAEVLDITHKAYKDIEVIDPSRR